MAAGKHTCILTFEENDRIKSKILSKSIGEGSCMSWVGAKTTDKPPNGVIKIKIAKKSNIQRKIILCVF